MKMVDGGGGVLGTLYRYELRTLRARLVAREIPKQGYSDRVVELRKKYFLLSIRIDLWAREV